MKSIYTTPHINIYWTRTSTPICSSGGPDLDNLGIEDFDLPEIFPWW